MEYMPEVRCGLERLGGGGWLESGGGGVGGWAGCNDLPGRQTAKSRTRVPAARVVVGWWR